MLAVVLSVGMMIVTLILAFLAVVMTQSVLSLNSKGVYENETISRTGRFVVHEREQANTGFNQRREVLHEQPREFARGNLPEGASVE